MKPNHDCPIRGHNHKLTVIEEHTQAGTGKKGYTLGCPSDRYRWFWVRGTVFPNSLKMVRPRWGWSKRKIS